MDEILQALLEIRGETGLPKAVLVKLDEITGILSGPGDTRLKISKALSEIEELSDNSSLPGFVRSQLWNIASSLEYQ